MKTKTIKLYSFDELSKEAKEKAICDHIEFEISEIGARPDDEELNPFWEYAQQMERNGTPWFLGQLIYEKEKDMIIDTLKANDYLFYKDGELIPLDMYPEKAPTLRERLTSLGARIRNAFNANFFRLTALTFMWLQMLAVLAYAVVQHPVIKPFFNR